MMGSVYGNVSRPVSGWARPRRWLMALVAVLIFLAVAPAYADDFFAGLGAVLEHVANIYLTLLVFNVVAWFIEAWILNRYLRMGYWKLFGLSALVNIVSTVLGLFFWPSVFGREGWKTAIVYGDWGGLGILFLRSFVLTIGEEGLILMAILRGRVRAIVVGVVVANLVTYVLAAIIMLCVR